MADEGNSDDNPDDTSSFKSEEIAEALVGTLLPMLVSTDSSAAAVAVDAVGLFHFGFFLLEGLMLTFFLNHSEIKRKSKEAKRKQYQFW